MLGLRAPAADDLDPVALTQDLIRRQSVTPANDGCLERCGEILAASGFSVDVFCTAHGEPPVTNLIGTFGSGGPVLAFAGHTDVVPAGDKDAWTHPPFAGRLADGRVWGRGAVDMKGAIAAFLAAARRYVATAPPASGTLVVLLTGDEEVGTLSGMRAILERVGEAFPRPQACLIGEPSCEGSFGQGIRVGRRGSLNVEATAVGVGGHVAWPDRASNALHLLISFLSEVRAASWGPGEACFPATNLEITSIGADSEVTNVIPGRATARFNIRFNRRHSGQELVARLDALARSYGPKLRLSYAISGEPYLAEKSPLPQMIAEEVEQAVGQRPEMNAGGGVSDGRFLRALCPVVEFGLVGDLAHKVDENVPVRDLRLLTSVYLGVLNRFFSRESVASRPAAGGLHPAEEKGSAGKTESR